MDEQNTGYQVFHTSEAGSPTAWEQQGWTYEPNDWDSYSPFAPAYATRQEAMDAAEDWLAKLSWEED